MRIYTSKNPSSRNVSVAERIRKDLLGYLQIDLPIEEADIPVQALLIGAGAPSFPWRDLHLPPEAKVPGSYALEISPSSVAIEGADNQGLLNAALTLAQLERYAFLRNADCLPESSVRDWPSIPTRLFVHWVQGITSRDCKVETSGIRAAEYKLLDRYIGDIKLNAYSLLAPDAILYDNPENRKVGIYPKGTFMDIPSLKAMRKHCDDMNVEFIPALCGPSHCLWMTVPYRELSMPGYSNWDANPADERFFNVYFSIMDELIPTGNSKRFMIWNDEWWHQPKGDFSSKYDGIEKRDIFRSTIERIHGHLKERGLQAVMFSDMLQKAHNGGAPYDNYLNAPLLPKDIVMAHWSNAKSAAADFSKLGYAESWLVTNRFYPHRIASSDIKARHIEGCGIIAYSSLTPDTGYGYGSNLRVSDYAWNLGLDNEMSLADWMLSKGRNVMANSSVLRNPAAARTFKCVDLEKSFNWQAGKLHPKLAGFPAGRTDVAFVPTLFASKGEANCAMPVGGEKVSFEIGSFASSLIFLHSQSLPKEKRKSFLVPKNSYDYFDGVRIGSYLVNYADGSSEAILIRSSENIGDLEPYPGIATGVLENSYLADCRFTLEMGEGEPGAPCLYQYEWVNPHPEKAISKIDFSSSGKDATPILFAVTARDVLQR